MITADTITHGNAKHGHSRSTATGKASPTYRTWVSMLARCNNPKASNYHLYGGRGIGVCSRWCEFEMFLADMGERPKGTTLDRVNTDDHYQPDNCRWATPAEQAQNRRPTEEWTKKPGSHNREKTHCKNGHALTDANVYRMSNDGRACRECKRLHDKKRRAK